MWKNRFLSRKGFYLIFAVGVLCSACVKDPVVLPDEKSEEDMSFTVEYKGNICVEIT